MVRMSRPHVNVERTLVALQAVALCCLVLAAILRIIDFTRSGTGLGVAITWLILTPVIGALWIVRPYLVRIGHGITLTILTIFLATPVAVFGSVTFTIPVLLLVVAFAVTDVSPKAGIHAMIWISVVGFTLLTSAGQGTSMSAVMSMAQGLVNVVPVVALLCFGFILGLALRGFEQRRNADQAIIERLQHTSEVEKELLLSDERARSARELHDGLGHRLTLVAMSLELAERLRSTDLDQAWQEIHMAKHTSSEALAEMRTWVRALSPVRDATARGLAALEMIAESFRGTGLTVEVIGDERSDHELVNNDAIALLMYRAVQEGLTNALRHGKAQSVQIGIRSNENRMILVIINDFRCVTSLNSADGEPTVGFGLRGLADRASDHGGTMRAHRIKNQFELEISVPLNRIAAGHREAVS